MQKLNKLIIASNNSSKVKEIKAILGGYAECILSLDEVGVEIDIAENGLTFQENAIIKAKAIYAIVGYPSIADDSGLEVDALSGAPGIYSARFAGAPYSDSRNNQLLLSNLKDNPERSARFVCEIALCLAEDNIICSRGECEGEIVHLLRGQGGFGYDPLFYSKELKKTFAEASPLEKNKVSHRAKALTKLAEILSQKE